MKRFIKNQYPMIALAVCLLVLSTLASIRISKLKGAIIDSAIAGVKIDIVSQLTMFIAMLVVSFGVGYIFSALRFSIRMTVMKAMKDAIMHRVLTMSRHLARNIDRSAVISKYTAELGIIDNNFLNTGGRVLEFVIVIVLTLAAVVRINLNVALISLAVYSIPIFVTKSQQKTLSDVQERYLEENKSHVAKFMSYIKGMEVIKNYHVESEISQIYDNSLSILTRADMQRGMTKSKINGVSMFLTFFSQGVISAYCAYQVYLGNFSVGDFVTIFSLTAALSSPVYWLARSVESVLSSIPAIKSVVSFLEETDDEDSFVLSLKPDDDVILKLSNVNFSYDDKKILSDLNLEVKRNEKLLIIGKSGSGKSTLLGIITGYLKPQSGKLGYADTDYSDFITLGSQDAFIFEDSLSGNLFSDDEQKNEKILCRVGLEDIAYKQSEFMLKEKGKNVSGGQKKRIALARSFLNDTPLLILDEPLANIDAENVLRIEDYISAICDRSVILISHQVSRKLIDAMDSIYLLTDGKLSKISAGQVESLMEVERNE